MRAIVVYAGVKQFTVKVGQEIRVGDVLYRLAEEDTFGIGMKQWAIQRRDTSSDWFHPDWETIEVGGFMQMAHKMSIAVRDELSKLITVA